MRRASHGAVSEEHNYTMELVNDKRELHRIKIGKKDGLFTFVVPNDTNKQVIVNTRVKIQWRAQTKCHLV